MDSEKDSVIYVRLAPQNITDVNCIMEGYEYLALVTTVDRISGIIKLSATPDTYEDTLKILEGLPFPVEIIGAEGY